MRTTDGNRRQKVGDVCLKPAIANPFRADSDIKQKRAAVPCAGPRPVRQSSGRWYTVIPPQWPNLSAPLTKDVATLADEYLEALAMEEGKEAE